MSSPPPADEPERPGNPLSGKPPAPDEFRDATPRGREPNDMVHAPLPPNAKERPQAYPAAKDGALDNVDVPPQEGTDR